MVQWPKFWIAAQPDYIRPSRFAGTSQATARHIGFTDPEVRGRKAEPKLGQAALETHSRELLCHRDHRLNDGVNQLSGTRNLPGPGVRSRKTRINSDAEPGSANSPG
jgi:hypothetical protein